MSLFTHRAYWRWSAGVQFARLPATMAPLAFTLLTTATTGSYRLGGVLMAAYVAAEMVCAVPAGRLLDRVGPARGLPVLLLLTAAGFAVLAVAAASAAPGAALLGLVLLPGITGGALSGGFRTLLADTVDDELLPRAISVDAMLLDGVLVGGPALVTLLDLAGPLVPLAAMAAACVAAAVLVPRRASTRESVNSTSDVPWSSPVAYLPWLCCAFTIGLLTSTIEVAPLPLVQRLGAPETAAPLVIAVLTGAEHRGQRTLRVAGQARRSAAAPRRVRRRRDHARRRPGLGGLGRVGGRDRRVRRPAGRRDLGQPAAAAAEEPPVSGVLAQLHRAGVRLRPRFAGGRRAAVVASAVVRCLCRGDRRCNAGGEARTSYWHSVSNVVTWADPRPPGRRR